MAESTDTPPCDCWTTTDAGWVRCRLPPGHLGRRCDFGLESPDTRSVAISIRNLANGWLDLDWLVKANLYAAADRLEQLLAEMERLRADNRDLTADNAHLRERIRLMARLSK